jgi:two-component system response regulator YesN
VIADKIGYEDSFYFSRIFKKMTGKSPKEYRLEVNSKKSEIVIEPSKG